MSVLVDPQIIEAISRIARRAESWSSPDAIDSYVDVGVLHRTTHLTHQVIYGRRGTGKTHLLRYIANKYARGTGEIPCYIDCRRYASGERGSDPAQRAQAVFRELCKEIVRTCRARINEPKTYIAKRAQANVLLGRVHRSLLERDEEARVKTLQVEIDESEKTQKHVEGSIKLAPSLGAAGGKEDSNALSKRTTATYEISRAESALSAATFDDLNTGLVVAQRQLVVLLDEWSSFPMELQPYLADLVRQCLLPLNRVTLKIGALEFRSSFLDKSGGVPVGLEIGADIPASLDLDDCLKFVRDGPHVTRSCARILYNHLTLELEADYLPAVQQIRNPVDLTRRFFDEEPTLIELARACEGVVRDLINIFEKACHLACSKGAEFIDVAAVRHAAREYHQQDKAINLGDEERRLFGRLVRETLSRRNVPCFMISVSRSRDGLLRELFESRVLHLIYRGFVPDDDLGAQYNVFSIDYGRYVSQIERGDRLRFVSSGTESVEGLHRVPFGDGRSILAVRFVERRAS